MFDIDESAIGLMCELFVRTALVHLAVADVPARLTQRPRPRFRDGHPGHECEVKGSDD